MGAASVLMAAAEEPRVAAVWEDSSYASIDRAIRDELARLGLPELLLPSALLVGQLVDGLDTTARSPIQAVEMLDGRPLFIAHGDADLRVSAQHAEVLAQALAADTEVTPWVAEGSNHVQAVFDYPELYEQYLVRFFQANLAN